MYDFKAEIKPVTTVTEHKKFDSMNQNLTVFISNLSFDVDEEKLEAVFSSVIFIFSAFNYLFKKYL